jgi:hypothetical protein
VRLTLLARQALAEFLGSAGLVAVVIGSGIAAYRLPQATRGCNCSRKRWSPAPG